MEKIDWYGIVAMSFFVGGVLFSATKFENAALYGAEARAHRLAGDAHGASAANHRRNAMAVLDRSITVLGGEGAQ